MKYTLMHKEYAVMDLDMDSYRGFIREIIQIYSPERMPLSVRYHEQRVSDLTALREWMQDRLMPVRTDETDRTLQENNLTIETLALLSFGLNLTDHYWIKPYGSTVTWYDVNFYYHSFISNPFHQKEGDEETVPSLSDVKSPDYCTNGNLPKFWYKWKGKEWLAKEGSNPYHQEVLNEVIASRILYKARIPHVFYKTITIDGKRVSACPNFVTPDTEFITAYDIWNVIPYVKHESLYKHFLQCAEALEIPGVKEQLDTMLQFDFLINNKDRHLRNFGFIRDVKTLKIIGMAPIFDNGNSLWYDKPIAEISLYKQEVCPFSSKQEKQLKLTTPHVSWIHEVSEEDLENILVSEFKKSSDISEQRINKILNTVLNKRNVLLDYELKKGNIQG